MNQLQITNQLPNLPVCSQSSNRLPDLPVCSRSSNRLLNLPDHSRSRIDFRTYPITTGGESTLEPTVDLTQSRFSIPQLANPSVASEYPISLPLFIAHCRLAARQTTYRSHSQFSRPHLSWDIAAIRVNSSLAINVNDCVTETKCSTNVDAATRMQLSHYLRPLPPPTLHAHSRPHRDVVECRGEAVRGEPWSLPDSVWVDPGGCGHGGEMT